MDLVLGIQGLCSSRVRGGRSLVCSRFTLAALTPFATAFTTAFATLTATFARRTLWTRFHAFGGQLWLGIGAAFTASIFAALACWTLMALATLCAITASRAGIAFTTFNTTI